MPRSAKHLRGEVKPSKFKTSMCQYFIKDAACPFGDKCAFAHGDTELRSEQQNITELATPSSEQANTPVDFTPRSEPPFKSMCGDILILPQSNGSSGRDLQTPPLGASTMSQNDAFNQQTPREDLGCSMSSSIAGASHVSVAVFQHNPYSPAGRSTKTRSLKDSLHL